MGVIKLTSDEREIYNKCESHIFGVSTTVYIPVNSSHDFRVEVDELLRNKNMFPCWINVNRFAGNIPSIVYIYGESYDNVLALTSQKQRDDVAAAITRE